MAVLVEKINRGMLSAREFDLLVLAAAGAVNKRIADVLGISGKTVVNHFDSIYRKMNVDSAQTNARCMAVAIAVAEKMIEIKKGDE